MLSESANAIESKRVADRYTLVDRIGSGGAAVVYRARDEGSNRIVAFKQLVEAKTGKRQKTLEALFEREYRTLVRLKHPRIIEVYDYGIGEDGPYYTMELLEGSDLGQISQLPYPDVCRHLRDVASSLALLHAQRLVHRDVSPRNIRLTEDGTARLLDFGALAAFGSNSEVIGTPPFMAPEVAQGLPLDARTDLFSLGAVGYFCLTRRSPFVARAVHELPRAWQSPPAPPSAFNAEVPPELDRLILSMLSLDPLGRPETAAAVIDKLTLIGRLAPEPHERAEQSYLLSSPLVGRGAQTDWVLGRIDRALDGRGGEVLIEGPAGIGKTRLANELCLAGTVKGAIALRADAERTRTSFGLAVLLASKLLEATPDVARRAAEPVKELLASHAPELAHALGVDDPAPPPSDPAERRMRFHAALREWFFAVSREQTLLVAVDNLQAADDDSASLLVSLCRESSASHLFVLMTFRTGTPVLAKDAVRLLGERAQRLRLPALDAKACELFASGLFGEAANAGRVGNLLFERSGGVPQQVLELAQLMVQKKIAKYEGGNWVLPLDIAEDELPARSDEILAARLSELSPEAAALAQTLAVHTGAVPLALALAVSGLPGATTYASLDELLAEQVLVSEGDAYRFRHEAIRAAVLSRLDPDALCRNRLRAAEALLASESSGAAERIEAALHLIDAGDTRRGTFILVAAAREFAAGAGMHQNPNQLVRALCRMVRTYDTDGRSDYELGALLFPLLPLAYYSADWQFILEYGERAIDTALRVTGLGRAAELAPELGPEEALKRALGEAAAAFAQHAEPGIGYDFKTAISATIGMVPACVAIYATCFERDVVSRLARVLTPLAFFGEKHVAHTMYLFAAAEARLLGCESESSPIWERVLSGFADPACAAQIGESRVKVLRGGALFTTGILDSYRFGDRALARAREMESLGVKAWEVAADQIRILYHSLRGESAEVRTYMDRVEQNAIQGAQTWQAEVFWPALLLSGDVLTGDAMAARRRYVQLERRSREAPALEPQAGAARAAYFLLRGDLSEAISLYESLLPRFPLRKSVNWETTRAYFAAALNKAGKHERAKAVAEEVVSNMTEADRDYVTRFLEAERQLALAEAGLGNHARAAGVLDGLLAKYGDESNSLLVGLLHQARADVALRAGDQSTAEAHRAEMERRFRSTRNPVLVAQCEIGTGGAFFSAVPAGRQPRQPSSRGAPDAGGTGDLAFSTTGATELADRLNAASSPYDAALDLVMSQTKARSAFLYVSTAGDLQLAWSSKNEEAPLACVEELGRWMRVVSENDGGATQTGQSVLAAETVTVSGYRLVALRAAEQAVVGGLVLEVETGLDGIGESAMFEALGRVVEEHGADALGFITA